MTSQRGMRIATRGNGTQGRPRSTRSQAAAPVLGPIGSSCRAALDSPAGLFSQKLASLSNTLKGYQTEWEVATDLGSKAQASRSDVPTPSIAMFELVKGLRVFEKDLASGELESYSQCVHLLPEIFTRLSAQSEDLLTETVKVALSIQESPLVWAKDGKGPISARFRKDALESALEDLKLLNGEERPEWMIEGYSG